MRYAAIIPAAGRGSRSGRREPKQFAEVAGTTVLAAAVDPFLGDPRCERIVIALDKGEQAGVFSRLPTDSRLRYVSGGKERQDSIANALADCGPVEYILVHDAARPCLDRALLDRVISTLESAEAVIPAIPVADTIKEVGDDVVIRTLDRSALRAVQTPQGFSRTLLEQAYRKAAETGSRGTDDASLVEAVGGRVVIVNGDRDNIKVTWKRDFFLASLILDERSSTSTD